MHALDARTQLGELFLDALVAAVEVVDALDGGLPRRNQTGQHQTGRGTQVGGHDDGAVKPRHPAHQGGVARDLYVGAQAAQFLHVHEAVFENGFGDAGRALGNTVHRHELRLHVGGKRRVRGGAHVHRFQLAVGFDFDPVVAGADLGPGFAQLAHHRIQRVGLGVGGAHAAAGHGGRNQEGAGLDAVGHHRIVGAVQLVDAVDGDDVTAGALDAGAHGDQAAREINHLGFARGVFQHGGAVGQGSGHHQVLGAGHGDHVHHDARALQPLAAGVNVAVLDLDVGAHRLQAFDVNVDRARADGAATGQADACIAEARQRRAQHQDGGAHGFHHFVGGFLVRDGFAAQGDVVLVVQRDAHAHVAEQGQHGADVLEMRHVRQFQRLGGEQAGGQDRQRGVLGAGNAHLTGKRVAAMDQQGIHSACDPVFGGISLHRQCVDLRVHAGAERVVDQAVLLDHVLAGESRADDHRLEMLAVAVQFDVVARQFLGDPAFDVVGSNHARLAFQCLSL